MSEALPRKFGPYLLLSMVGRGGMGEVYLAKSGGLRGYEKHCVVKTLRADTAADNEYVQRFSEEARVVVQLAHRNICAVFDVGRAEGRLYLAMEHIVGRDLRSVAHHERLPIAIAIHVVSEVLEALDYAHRFVDATTGQALGLVHRDVSPHNVLLGVEGDVKLIDFGIATSVRQGPLTARGDVLGKLTYMAPEHARGDEVDGRADQFSAAVTLIELLTGQGLYEGMSRDQAWAISGVGGHRPTTFGSIDAELRGILDRALAPRCEERFPSCSAFAEALTGWALARGLFADARSVRQLMAQRFGDLAAEARGAYRPFRAVAPPAMEDATGPASGWESIATTMMVAPPTTGFDAPRSSTGEQRDTNSAPTAPVRARRTSLAIAAAVGALVVGVGITAAVAVGGEPVVVAPLPPAPPPTPMVVPPPLPPNEPPIEPLPAPVEPVRKKPAEPSTRPDKGPPDKPVVVDKGPVVKVKWDDDTTSSLAFLKRECLGKVSCAANVVEWSRRTKSDLERQQVAEAASSCARSCRLK
ncbi:MAG: serine/threonine protein kinase [Deltaproteobacteria bacterium]|nr:serine/threonine protein kinase [Deltaproteobacteria bacterium]